MPNLGSFHPSTEKRTLVFFVGRRECIGLCVFKSELQVLVFPSHSVNNHHLLTSGNNKDNKPLNILTSNTPATLHAVRLNILYSTNKYK